ncbi:restriction endonuclease S subunit [Mycolicibacterium phlei]|uniref:restriction endonuclease subunit S n=1 Tax=Mycolicibacterium phlei TaxID=1771 RepID=UPI00078D84B0|nr:Type I restriction modification DNA specificity domain protein [Mycolicibacterium phlei]STZ17384.1 restriction endonuclease S subunit [Mycolicibacterium phlei]VEG08935.1 restriction endonuclease S subunit [Mycobacteroides chelonae]
MGEWREATVAELGTIFDGPHATPTRRSSGAYFLNISSLKNGRLDLSESDHVSDEDFQKWTRRVTPTAGDLLFSYETRLGEAALMPAGVKACLGRRMALLRPDRSRFDPRFLLYLYLGPAFQEMIAERSIHGATVSRIPLASMPEWPVFVPDLQEQCAIADVLGALDDKIAANERLVDLVDQYLATVFARLAANSPTAVLAMIADVNRAVVKPSPGGVLRYVDISAVAQGKYEFPEPITWESAPGRARRALAYGDTVWSTVRPNRRSHALVLDSDPALVASTGLAVLTPHAGRIAGLYEATRRSEFTHYLESVAEGSAYPAVNADRFRDAPIPALSEEAWNEFEQEALPLRQRAHAAAVETRALRRTRDELLPLLMSGRITISAAGRTAGEVT